jgi:hypothetical protein
MAKEIMREETIKEIYKTSESNRFGDADSWNFGQIMRSSYFNFFCGCRWFCSVWSLLQYNWYILQ